MEKIVSDTDVPRKWAVTPIRELPSGAKPRNTRVYSPMIMPLIESGAAFCMKLLPKARKLTMPYPAKKIRMRET